MPVRPIRAGDGEKTQMKGANKSFMQLKHRFLEQNLIVMQSNLQDQIFGWAQLNNALTKPTDVTEAHFGTVWEFDLVEVPHLFDSFRAYGQNPNGKAPKVYELRLMNRVDNVPTKERDANDKIIVKGVTRKVGKHTHKLTGFYCPWSGDRVWSVDLDDRADFFFTATLNGCTVAVEGAVDPKVSHANYIDPTNQQIDQTTIDTEIGRRHAATDPRVGKADYTNVAKKTRRLAKGKVLDYLATVIGFRDPATNQWSFYYQSYKKFQTQSATNPAATLNNAVLRDRAVRLV